MFSFRGCDLLAWAWREMGDYGVGEVGEVGIFRAIARFARIARIERADCL